MDHQRKPLFQLLGFPVYVPLTAWLGIALVAYANAPAFVGYGGSASTLAYAMGLYVTVLVHELAHAIVARRTGHQVVAITLGVLGGATLYNAEAHPNPKHELRVALAGPLSSIGLGMLLQVAAPGDASPVSVVVSALGFMNVLLGVLNLLPAAPLDGGHVCEAVVWRLTRSRRLGMRVTAVLGWLIGAVLMALGLAPTAGGVLLLFFGVMFMLDASVQWRLSAQFR